MNRRKLLMVGAAAGSSSIAGCFGGDEEQPDETPTTESEEDGGSPDTSEESEAGKISFSVDPSATEIEWGEEYSVTVTMQAGDEPVDAATGIVYQTEADATWSGNLGNTEMMWRLDAGESQSETFEIEPPAVGEFTLGLVNAVEEDVVEEWDLTVTPPVQSLGETLSYYDGLDMSVDAELQEWIDVVLTWDQEDEAGTYSVRPAEGQWVKVNIVAENTNMNTDVGIPGYGAFSALAGNSQLDHPRYLGTDVGAGTEYVVDDQTRHEEGSRLEMNDGGEPGQEGFWLPPDELIPDAREEGWVLFEAATDTAVEDVEIRLQRNDVRATWE